MNASAARNMRAFPVYTCISKENTVKKFQQNLVPISAQWSKTTIESCTSTACKKNGTKRKKRRDHPSWPMLNHRYQLFYWNLLRKKSHCHKTAPLAILPLRSSPDLKKFCKNSKILYYKNHKIMAIYNQLHKFYIRYPYISTPLLNL